MCVSAIHDMVRISDETGMCKGRGSKWRVVKN